MALEDRVLEAFDPMLGEVLMGEMEKQGIRLHLGCRVTGLTETDRGIAVDTAGSGRLNGFDTVIWAVGRVPNTAELHLEAAGVEVQGNGIILTDEYQNTNVPGIYAIGGVTGRTPLTRWRLRRGGAWPNACSATCRRPGWITTTSRAWCFRIRRWRQSGSPSRRPGPGANR